MYVEVGEEQACYVFGESICNHCHSVKRSKDVITDVVALPSLFTHLHNAHNNEERQAEGRTLDVRHRKAALI
jgi:hypothetical protein